MSHKTFIILLYLIIGALLAINLFVIYNEMVMQQHTSFSRQFYFDRRLNVPFFFSVLLLLINMFLLFGIVVEKGHSKSQKVFWTILLITFLLFTIDEAFYIHQHYKMSTFGRVASYDRKSWTHYLWVIPYFIVFGTLLAALWKYATEINAVLKRKLVFAAIIFLFGAVLMEFIGTYYAVIHPRADIYILLIKTTEAVFQLVGAVMFVDVFIQKKSMRF